MHGEQSVVVDLKLQVILAPDGDQWIAQAIELDYAASGTSKEDVKERFEKGLVATIGEHFKIFGHLDNLGDAPAEDWRDLTKTGQLQIFSTTSFHTFEMPPGFPFGTIDYLSAAAAA